MAINVKRARRALRNAGLQSSARLGLAWPIGRQKRVTTLLRERREVLEAKNHVVEFLFRTQRGLSDLRLSRVEHVHTALQDPQKRRIIMTVGASQVMLAEELSAMIPTIDFSADWNRERERDGTELHRRD